MILMAFVLAAGAAASAQAAVAAPAPAKDPLICVNQSRTNTRFTKRVCTRRSDLDARAIQAQRTADEVINRPAINRVDTGG